MRDSSALQRSVTRSKKSDYVILRQGRTDFRKPQIPSNNKKENNSLPVPVLF